jgi:hypothetical protein
MLPTVLSYEVREVVVIAIVGVEEARTGGDALN